MAKQQTKTIHLTVKQALPVVVLLIVACVVVLVILQVRANRRREEEDDYLPPPSYDRPRGNAAPPADPYDYRDEISRVATEYSRPVPGEEPAPRRRPAPAPLPDDEDEDVVTVYR